MCIFHYWNLKNVRHTSFSEQTHIGTASQLPSNWHYKRRSAGNGNIGQFSLHSTFTHSRMTQFQTPNFLRNHIKSFSIKYMLSKSFSYQNSTHISCLQTGIYVIYLQRRLIRIYRCTWLPSEAGKIVEMYVGRWSHYNYVSSTTPPKFLKC